MSLLTKIKRFVACEDGPTSVEYAILLALIIMVCFAAVITLGTKTATSFTNMSNSLNSGS